MMPNSSSVSFASRLAVGSSSTRTRVSSSSARAMAIELLDGHRIRAERPLDVDVDIEALQPLARQPSRAAPGDQPEPARLAAERQVLGHRHRRDEIDFLVDRADAEGLRLAGRADLDRMAVEPDLAPVAAQSAGQDLDQRRLAGAVFAHQRVDFAGFDPKIDPLQRPHAGKRLRDPEHLNSRSQGFRPLVGPADMFTRLAGAQSSHKARAGRGNAPRQWPRSR